jgi:hypothetical protein
LCREKEEGGDEGEAASCAMIYSMLMALRAGGFGQSRLPTAAAQIFHSAQTSCCAGVVDETCAGEAFHGARTRSVSSSVKGKKNK